jgi:hypothetical protein
LRSRINGTLELGESANELGESAKHEASASRRRIARSSSNIVRAAFALRLQRPANPPPVSLPRRKRE